MSDAIGGYNTVLTRNATTIAELTKIEPPEIKRNTFDSTHMQSPGRVMEKGKALVEIGDISIEGNYIPANATHNAATGLLSDFTNHTGVDTYAIVFPNSASTTWSGPGILTSFKPGPELNGKLSFSATITPSGQWTLA
jgi:hypothetical protein